MNTTLYGDNFPTDISVIETCQRVHAVNLGYAKTMMILFGIVAGLGIISNTFVLAVVLITPTMRNAFHIYTTNMAVICNLYLGIYSTLKIVKLNDGDCWSHSIYALRFLFCVAYAGPVVLTFLMTALTVDRYYAIIRPFKWKKCSKRRAIQAVIVIWLATGVAALQRGNHLTIHKFTNGYILATEDSQSAKIYWQVHTTITLIWVILMCFLNIHLLVLLRSLNRSHKQKTKRVQLMFLVFVLCVSPSYLYIAIERWTKFGDTALGLRVQVATILSTTLHSAINPWIIGSGEIEYKEVLCKLLRNELTKKLTKRETVRTRAFANTVSPSITC